MAVRFPLLVFRTLIDFNIICHNGVLPKMEWCSSKAQRDFEVLLHSLYHIKEKGKKSSGATNRPGETLFKSSFVGYNSS